MFSSHLPNTPLAFASTLFCSITVFAIFLAMAVSYTQKRANQAYAEGKQPVPSVRRFKPLSKIIFVINMLITLASYWLISPLFLTIHHHLGLQLLGALIVLIGYINLNRAFIALGDNYSPLFDSYAPNTLITEGIYSTIRHPIYLFNLFVSFGLALSSGSLIVLAGAIVGLLFILKAISLEEAYLINRFPEYPAYTQRTSRLIPFIF